MRSRKYPYFNSEVDGSNAGFARYEYGYDDDNALESAYIALASVRDTIGEEQYYKCLSYLKQGGDWTGMITRTINGEVTGPVDPPNNGVDMYYMKARKAPCASTADSDARDMQERMAAEAAAKHRQEKIEETRKFEQTCRQELLDVVSFWKDWIENKHNGLGRVVDTSGDTRILFKHQKEKSPISVLQISVASNSEVPGETSFILSTGKTDLLLSRKIETSIPNKLLQESKEKLVEEAWFYYVSLCNVEENSLNRFNVLKNNIVGE